MQMYTMPFLLGNNVQVPVTRIQLMQCLGDLDALYYILGRNLAPKPWVTCTTIAWVNYSPYKYSKENCLGSEF